MKAFKLLFKALHEEKRPVKAHTITTKSGEVVQIQQHTATKKISDQEAQTQKPTAKPDEQSGIRIGKKDEPGTDKARQEQKPEDKKAPESKDKPEAPKPATGEPEDASKKTESESDTMTSFKLAGTVPFVFRNQINGFYRQEYTIPLDMVMQNPKGQIRETEDKDHIKYLSELIGDDGQSTPLMVRIFEADEEGNTTGQQMLVLLSGNHRFLALKKLEKEGKIDPISSEPFLTANVRIVEKDYKLNQIDEIMENYSQKKMNQFEDAKSSSRIYAINKQEGKTDEEAVAATAKKMRWPEKKTEKSISMMNLVPELRHLCGIGSEKGGLDFDSSYELSRFDKKDQMAIFLMMRDFKTWEARKRLISSYFLQKKVIGNDLFGNAPKSLDEIGSEMKQEKMDAETMTMKNRFSDLRTKIKTLFKIGSDYNRKAKSGPQKEPSKNYADSLSDDEVDAALEDALNMQYAINSMVSSLQTRQLNKSSESGPSIRSTIIDQTRQMSNADAKAYLENERSGRGLLHMDGVAEEIDRMNQSDDDPSEQSGSGLFGKAEMDMRKGCWEKPEDYTKKEFLSEATKQDQSFIPLIEGDDALRFHKQMISDAISRKKKLRPEVMADYPELTRDWSDSDGDYDSDFYYEVTGQPRPGEVPETDQVPDPEPVKKSFIRWRQRWIH